jgi:hypothetical protein
MESDQKATGSLQMNYRKTSVARWTIEDFFGHVNGQTEYLESEQFMLYGFTSKFHLRVFFRQFGSNSLSYYLRVDMANEKLIQLELNFWLENSKSKRFVETPGRYY